MSKFTFALPNGKFFELIGPADATVAQAEKIFLQQLAAGAIVGLADGNTLEAPAARLIKFTQSRLDRGTAGTADLPLLAINNQGILSALPPLSDTQVENGINVADFLDTQPAAPVGPLSPTQVQALAAQVAKNVDQPASVVTRDKGVGKYGFNLPQLEQLGLLKPGTSCRCTDLPPSALSGSIGAAASPNPANFLPILQSPSVWTGQDNVRGLSDILTNSGLQDRLQTRLIQNSYDTLLATGQIDVAAGAKSLPVGQVFTGGQESAALSSLGQVGTLALGLSGLGLLGAGSLSSLTQSVSSVFSSAGKGISSLFSGAGGVNFAAAGNLSFEGLGGSLSKAAGNLSNLASRGVAELGGLLSNASKFGPETAVEWAKGLAPADLTSQLNQLAKQGQFAINFSDFKIPNVVSGVAPAAAFKGTVNRATVDSAFVKLLGSNKIPVPDLAIPSDIPLSFDSLEPAMKNATALLKNTTNLAGQIPALAGGLTTNLSNSSILDQAQGALAGGVVAVPGMPNTDAFGSVGSSLEQNLYGRAPDSDLVYTGRDDTVWDRINAERLRRGLPGLAAIGYPRPDDNMVIYT